MKRSLRRFLTTCVTCELSMVFKSRYLSSIDATNEVTLLQLQQRMQRYYSNSQYHNLIKGINPDWEVFLFEACKQIPLGSFILEVGCGDGSGAEEIKAQVKNSYYIGTDLNPDLWKGKHGFVAALAQDLPFKSSIIDVVLSLFVIEHLAFPARFWTRHGECYDQVGAS